MSYNKEYIEELKNLLELYLHKDTFELSIKLINMFINKYNIKSNFYTSDDYNEKGIHRLRTFSCYNRSLIYMSDHFKISFEYAVRYHLGDKYEYIILRDSTNGHRFSIDDRAIFNDPFLKDGNKKLPFCIKILDRVLNEEYNDK